MKKNLLLLVLMCFMITPSFSQVSGTFAVPGDIYPSVQAAIAAINASGVGTGGVTFNIKANYSETFTSSTAGYITTNTATGNNPVIFQRSGAGANPVLVAPAGTGTMDAIICFDGVSYIKFDGIDLQENPLNSTNTARMEWGYALLKASGQQGSQNITIKNCAISLNGTYNVTWAVYSNNHTDADVNQLVVNTPAGTNSYNRFSGITVTNCYNGFYFSGYNDVVPYTYIDHFNEVGVDGGNTVTSWGGGTASGYGIYGFYQGDLRVANNLFNGNTGSSIYSGSLYATYLAFGNNTNMDLYGNTVSVAYNSKGSFMGLYCLIGAQGENNTTNVHHNSVTGCSCPNMTNGSWYGFNSYGGTNANWYNNSVTNNTFGSSTASATGSMVAFNFTTVQFTYGPISIHDNVISGNSRIQQTPGPGEAYWFYASGQGTTWDCYNNIIDNNSSTSTGTQYVAYLIGYPEVKNFHDNTITNFTSINGNVSAIYCRNGIITNVYNNKVSNINALSNTSSVYGIHLYNGETSRFYNNFISELNAPNSTSTNAICGVFLNSGTNAGLYNNTIFLNSTSSAGSFGTAGIYVNADVNADLRNNIVVNTSAHNGSAYTVALQYSGPVTSANYASTSNNNDYYAGIPGPNNLVFSDGNNFDQTIGAFRARVSPRDASSFTELPAFVNVTTQPYDLHLQTGNPTLCESGGIAIATPVSMTTDIDNEPRYPLSGYPNNPGYPASGPDVGADEFGGIPQDLVPPSITFTPLLNTSSFGNRTLTTEIADVSGVPVAGAGLPVLYWKKFASGSWNAVTASWQSGSTYAFSFGTGVVTNDSVYYFVVAQDNVLPNPNIGSTPPNGSGYTNSPPACATPPPNANLFAYKIVSAICGTINVGNGQTYPTITAALTDISNKEVTCPVTLLLHDASYNAESFPLVFGNFPGLSTTNTITVKPKPGQTTTISGSSATAIIKFAQSSHIIIDGSNNGGTDRSLTIANNSASGTTAAIWVGSSGPGKGSTHIAIRNCNISNGYNTALNYGIFAGSELAIGTVGENNNNLIIQNNAISNAFCGLGIIASSSGTNSDLVIRNNVIGYQSSNSFISMYGIYLTGAVSPHIIGNEIFNLISSGITNTSGIELHSNISGAVVEGNKIHDLQNNSLTGWGAYGINIGAVSVDNVSLINNAISNITTINYSISNTIYNPFGIRITGGTGHKIYSNTVNLTGVQYAYGSSGTLSAALLFTDVATGSDVRDNIFANSLMGRPGSTSYCIYGPAGTGFAAIDYNDYYPSDTYGVLGYLGGSINSLAAWQNTTGGDMHSIQSDPAFTSLSDLHPTAPVVQNSAMFLPEVTSDIEGNLRANPTDMGCYLVSGTAYSVGTLAATSIGENTVTLNGTATAANHFVTTGFEYGITPAYGSYIAGLPSNVSGNAPTPFNAIVPGLSPNTTYHFRATGTSGGVVFNGADMTFTTATTVIPVTVNVFGEISNDTCMNATQTITVGGPANMLAVIAGGSVTLIAGQQIIFLPGTSVQSGGYLLGRITTTGDYCGNVPPMMAALKSGTSDLSSSGTLSSIRVYPNPTPGKFTLDIKGEMLKERSKVQVISMHGGILVEKEFSETGKHDLSLSDKPAGIYLLRVISSGRTETVRIIKQ